MAFLFLWQLAVIALGIPNHLIPTPWQILSKLVHDAPLLVKDIKATFIETVLGFGCSVLISIPVAVLIVWSQRLERAFMPLLIFTQTVPLIAVIPILIIWFGMGIVPKVITVLLLSFFQMIILTVSGLKSVEPEMIDLMRSMSASTLCVFWKVRFPTALPFVFDGMKLAALLSVIGAVVAEILGADYGLGHVIVYAINDLNTDLLFATIFLLTAIGATLFYSLVHLERVVLFWHVAMRKDESIRDVG